MLSPVSSRGVNPEVAKTERCRHRGFGNKSTSRATLQTGRVFHQGPHSFVWIGNRGLRRPARSDSVERKPNVVVDSAVHLILEMSAHQMDQIARDGQADSEGWAHNEARRG